MGMNYRGFGRGKLLLFGEHAAVAGYPALGVALDRGIAVSLEPDPAALAWTLEGRGEEDTVVARAVMKRMDASISGLPSGGTIAVESDLPVGRGFGSSSALCVALTEASLCAAGTPEVLRHRALVWGIAHHAEGVFHGTPSGIDTGLAVLGGIVAFSPKPPGLPEWRRVPGRPLHLVVGSLPRRGSAKELIADIRRRSSDPANAGSGAVSRLGDISKRAESLFSEPGSREAATFASAFGSLAREAEEILSTLGLVDRDLALLVDAGEKAGSCGGKMSGAGGGGAFWLVYADARGAEEGVAALRATAAEAGLLEELTLEAMDF